MANIFDYFSNNQSDSDVQSLMDIQDVDVPLNFENNDLMSSEFFDSVLSMERENGIDENFLNDINSDATLSEGSSSHVEEVLSPSGISSDCDFFNINTNKNISLLLPVNVKRLKIINASDLKMSNMKVTPLHCQTLLKKNVKKYITETVDDDAKSENESETRYPPLNLTAEEKRLLFKEGIQLPTHYPLTKNEEKELKRIRRKIRNKISAQDSRKRKKEYVDKLEEKAKKTTEENEFLKKRIKLLRKQNSKLVEQMQKLQEVLFNSTSSKATPTTCLMIVLFSTLLVCLPNMRLSDKTEIGEHLHAARRALLFNQQATNEDETLNMDDYLVFNKDDETELENFDDNVNEIENNTENAFVKFLNELSKKTELLSPETNCSDVKDEHLLEFCKRYEGDIKTVINNMKELLEKDGSYINEKKFIEPDISDDEDSFGMKTNYDEPPTKKLRINNVDGINAKDLPIFHEYNSKLVDDVISATVETKSYERNIQQE